MITSIFINALGQAIFESCGQALLVYVVLQLGMQIFPGITAKYKYDIYYLGLTVITCWFMANLVNIYLRDAAIAKYAAITPTSPLIYGVKYMPTLLQRAEGFISQYAFYIVGLYMLGLLLHSFKLIGGFVHIHYIRKQNNLTQDSVWTAKALQLSKQLEVLKKVSLYFSSYVQVPLTIGYFKPIIIFPIALINNLDNEQVEAILLHELAHIKRHDYLLNILQCIMETILCFNPFVWLISKTIRQEREYCCDDMVMDAEYNNFTYSKALYIIAKQNSQNYTLAMASAGSKKYPLLNRIKRLNMKTNDSLPKFHLLIIVTVAAIGALLAWGIPQYSMAKTKDHKKITAIKSTLPKAPRLDISLPIAPPVPAVASVPNVTALHNVMVKVHPDTLSNNADTTLNHASKFKIVIEDNKGNKKEYNSINDLSQADKDEFLKENPSFFGTFNLKFDSLKFANIENFKMSPEFQKAMTDAKMQGAKIRIQMNSPEWKKQMADIQLQSKKMALEMQKSFKNNPEWKKQAEEMKAQAEKIKEQFNSPEWKKQIADMQVQSKKMAEQMQNNPQWKKQIADIQIQSKKIAEQMRKQLNSPAWKKQMANIQIQSKKMAEEMNSPEWRKQMEDLQQEIKNTFKDETRKSKDEKEEQDSKDTLKSAPQEDHQ